MKINIIFFLMVVISLSLSSCKTYTDEPPPRDKSLAGSVSFEGYRIEATGSYGKDNLENLITDISILDIRKISNETVFLYCKSDWDDYNLRITIPEIDLSGKPHNALIDNQQQKGTVSVNGIEYKSVEFSIEGKITELNPITRGSPAIISYDCDIRISCEVDGENLALHITDAFF